MKLRVLHIASGDGWGGAERVLSLLLEGMMPEGSIETEVLLLNEGRLADAVRNLGIRVHVISEGHRSFARLVWTIRRWVAGRSFDIIHAHRYKEVIIGVLALAPRLRRLIVTVHGLEPWSQLTMRQRLRIWGALVLARLYGARFVGVSEEIAQRLASRVGKVHVVRIPNPMPRVPACESDNLRDRFGWDARRPVVGFVGRLEEVKGPDYFLEVASRSGEENDFVFIGTGSMQSGLLSRVLEEGLGHRVGFLGEVPDASGYLRQLDVLAITSRHEGLPMVLLEAAACEVPVVAFNVGGVADILDGSSAARLVRPGDVTAFCAAIDELLMDREAARTEAARWANHVRGRFSLPQIVCSYLAVYRGSHHALQLKRKTHEVLTQC